MTPSAPNQPDLSASESEIPELPLAEARELFTVLQKALRAFLLYDENNPVYQRFVRNLQGAFKTLWNDVDELRIQVDEFRFLWFGEEVYRNETRAESLAFTFYKDGVRDVRFLKGIEEQEIEPLLQVLQRARSVRAEGEDLLTILWDADLKCLEYHYIDLLAEGVDIPEKSAGLPDLSAAFEEEVGEDTELVPAAQQAADSEPPKAKVGADDFNPYALFVRSA